MRMLKQQAGFKAVIVLLVSLMLMFTVAAPMFAASAKTSKSTDASVAPPKVKYDQKAGLYGYVDKNNKWVIEPRFLEAKEFSDGLAAVGDGFVDPTWGYIKPDGSYAIKPQFMRAYNFNNGFAVVNDKGLAGTIDKSGKFILKPKYYLQDADNAELYRAVITDVNPNFGKEHHNYGFISNKGVLVEPKYAGPPAREGTFNILRIESKPGDVTTSKYYAVFDDGKLVALDSALQSVNEGIGLFTYLSDQTYYGRGDSNLRYAYLLPNGKIIKTYKDEKGKEWTFVKACGFSEGFACVAINQSRMGETKNDRWGFMKKDGTWLVKPTYLKAGSFHEGVAPVQSIAYGEYWGYLKKDLTWLIEPHRFKPAARINAAIAKNLDIRLYNQQEYDFVEKEAQAIVKKIVNGSMSEYDKVSAIYNYVTKNVKYDTSIFALSAPRASYSAYGALKYNQAVCQGFAELMTLMLNIAGIENRLVVGNIIPGDNELAKALAAGTLDPELQEDLGHAWNMVRIDGRYYNVDATWDYGRDPVKFKYFLKSDEYFKESRMWDYSYYPNANRDYN